MSVSYCPLLELLQRKLRELNLFIVIFTSLPGLKDLGVAKWMLKLADDL